MVNVTSAVQSSKDACQEKGESNYQLAVVYRAVQVGGEHRFGTFWTLVRHIGVRPAGVGSPK